MPKGARRARGWVVSSLDTVAAFFGAHRDTVRREWRAAGMPGQPGAWPLDEIAQWQAERLRQRADDASRKQQAPTPEIPPDGILTIEQARDNPEWATEFERWRKLHLENNRKSALLVYRDEAEREIAQLAIEIRMAFESLPEEFSLELPVALRPQAQARLRQLISLKLRTLAAASSAAASG